MTPRPTVPAFPTPGTVPALSPVTGATTFLGPGGFIDGSGAYPGPWFIEEQSLDIQYVRFPIFDATQVDHSTSNTTLSGIVTTAAVVGTDLMLKIIAQTHTYLSYGDRYATSSYFQPQKFSIMTNGYDVLGNSYGTPVGYQLGPWGNIFTSQRFIKRKPLSDATQWELDNLLHDASTTLGQSCYASTSSCAGKEVCRWNSWEQAMWGKHLSHGMTELLGYGWAGPDVNSSMWWDETATLGSPAFGNNYLGGSYSLTQEVSSIGNVRWLVDWIGANLPAQAGIDVHGRSYSNYVSIPSNRGTTGNDFEDGHGSLNPLAFCTVHPEYNMLRHDWN